MGKIVYAAAMSHVLAPDYYGKNVGPHGRKMVEELIDVVRDMGRTMLAARPDALVVIADDHLNVFSFDAVPAMCVRIGRFVERTVQADAIECDHEALCALTTKELHESGSHELLNWMVLIGAVSPAAAKVRFFGEMGRIDLAAIEWSVR
jgi:hypothetical protein